MDILYQNDLDFMQRRAFSRIAGIDEAGRGALAGPLVVSAVVLDYAHPIEGLNDSKQLSAARREKLYAYIMDSALAVGIIEIPAAEVDRINIRQASILGFALAFQALQIEPDFALIDGKDAPEVLSGVSQAVIKGDSLHACIAAASILAKVHRDSLMTTLDRCYPEYSFARHKGYGTLKHYAALSTFGACKEHRISFRLF